MSKKISELDLITQPTGNESVPLSGDQRVKINDLLPVQLQGDKTVGINGHTLVIEHENQFPLFLDAHDPTSIFSRIGAYHNTDGGNIGMTYFSATEGDCIANIEASFNDDAKLAQIHLHASAGIAEIVHDGDTHNFNTGDVILTPLAGGGTTGASIDDDGKIIRTP